MRRLTPTGNATFDKAEATAYAAYIQTMASVPISPQGEALAEFGYFYACWVSAITQMGPQGDAAGITAGYSLAGHLPTVNLDGLPQRLAAKVRQLIPLAGFAGSYNPIPATFYVLQSGVPTEATEGASYAVGDTFKITGGGCSVCTPVTALCTVLTVTSGGVETFSVTNMGLYTTTPANDAATNSTSGSGDNNLTVTLTWAQLIF